MAFTSGRITACYECKGTDLEQIRESFDEHDRIYVGAVLCRQCGCSMLYSRRAETEEEREMAKGRKTRKKPDLPAEKITHRVNKSNGRGAHDSSMEVAPVEAPERPMELGPIELPEGEDALRAALLDLAEANDRALRAGKAFLDLSEKTKTAKKLFDAAQLDVLKKLRLYTHAADLPLFDGTAREQDQAAMEQAGDLIPGDADPGPVTDGDGYEPVV